MRDGFAFQKQRTPEYLHKYQLAIDDRVTLQRSDQTDSGNRPLCTWQSLPPAIQSVPPPGIHTLSLDPEHKIPPVSFTCFCKVFEPILLSRFMFQLQDQLSPSLFDFLPSEKHTIAPRSSTLVSPPPVLWHLLI